MFSGRQKHLVKRVDLLRNLLCLARQRNQRAKISSNLLHPRKWKVSVLFIFRAFFLYYPDSGKGETFVWEISWLLIPNLISHGLKGKSRGRFVEDLNRGNRRLVNDLFPAVQWISRKPEIQREQEIS